ncbi:metallophosphoesterase family protein [Paenibacillus xylanexedens]|uniref:metallophosphoesterase family protein n=1 Tax=Paenibacillus xylanexedens TaxID=528191 RepID=UPI0011A0D883|nr:metallophosphoesterase [Paenibacillus xylanexedens]
MRLALLGDFHYSSMSHGTEEMKAARVRAYEHMLEAFLKEEADFHISIGDLTHEGTAQELRSIYSILARSERNFIHVLGNHDTYSIPKHEISTLTGQDRYRTIDTPHAKLVFLDTTQEMNREDWGGELDGEQLAWLKDQLADSHKKQVLLFGHHPVFDTTARSTLDKLYVRPQDELKSIFNSRPEGGIYFCGHNHINSIVKQAKWHYVQTAACLDVPAYRVIEVHEGKVAITHRLIQGAGLIDDIQSFCSDMPGFGPVADALGEENDLILSIQLASAAQ